MKNRGGAHVGADGNGEFSLGLGGPEMPAQRVQEAADIQGWSLWHIDAI